MEVKVDPLSLVVQNASRAIVTDPTVANLNLQLDLAVREAYEAGRASKKKELTHQLRTVNRHLRSAEKKLTQIYATIGKPQ